MLRHHSLRSETDGFSLPELSIAVFLFGMAALIAANTLLMTASQRRTLAQDRTIGDLSRQIKQILINPQYCRQLFKCNMPTVNVNTLGASIPLSQGVVSFGTDCYPTAAGVIAPTSGTIAALGLSPLGDSTLIVSKLELNNPAYIARNATSAGTFTTLSYNLELDLNDSVASGSLSKAPGNLTTQTTRLVFRDVAMLINNSDNSVASCSNLRRWPAVSNNPTSFGTLSCASSGIGSLSGNSFSCANMPTCPQSPVTCGSMTALKTATASAPAVYFSGVTPTGSVASGSNQICTLGNLTGYSPSQTGVVNIGASTVGNVTNMINDSSSMFLNAVTVGNISTRTNGGDIAIVANTIGDIQLPQTTSGTTCIAAQSIRSVTAQGNVSLYAGPNTGTPSGTISGTFAPGANSTLSVYVQGFVFGQAINSMYVGPAAFTNCIIPSINATWTSLTLNQTTISGALMSPNNASLTVNGGTIGGQVTSPLGGSMTVSGSSLGSVSMNQNSTAQIANSTIGGDIILNGNGTTVTLGTVRLLGGMPNITNSNTVNVTGGSIGGLISVSGQPVTLNFSGVQIGGSITGGGQQFYLSLTKGTRMTNTLTGPWKTITFGSGAGDGTYVNQVTITNSSSSITVNGGTIGTLTANPSASYVTDDQNHSNPGPTVNCINGGKVQSNQINSALTGITVTGC